MSRGSKKKKLRNKNFKIAAIIVSIVAVLILFQFLGFNSNATGVERVFEKNAVVPGEVIEIKLHINLNKNQDYYLIEEIIPEGFVVLDSDVGAGNSIRLAKIQNAESTVYSYRVEAPQEKGVYFFSGEYGMELLEGTMVISGDDKISVE